MGTGLMMGFEVVVHMKVFVLVVAMVCVFFVVVGVGVDGHAFGPIK
jgi:hypothetical protein